MYARRTPSTSASCSATVNADQGCPSGVGRAPDSYAAISSLIGRALAAQLSSYQEL